MKTYIDAVANLKKHLLPKTATLFWHDGKTELEVKKILSDLKFLYKNKKELTEDKQEQLQRLYVFVKEIYSDYNHHKEPDKMTAEELDRYLLTVAKWFEERYRIVMSNSALKWLFKRTYCDLFYGKGVDVEGDDSFTGPAVVMSTHYHSKDPITVQALSPNYIYWIADPGPNPYPSRRFFGRPFIRNILERLGFIEIDRTLTVAHLRKALIDSIHVLEHKKLLGITPIVRKKSKERAARGSGFGVYVVQKAQELLGFKIPIIPIGIKKQKGRLLVRIGKRFYLPNENEGEDKLPDSVYRKKLVKDVIEKLEYLAR